MLSQDDFREAFQSEVGDDVFAMIRPEEVDRWINRAQARLGYYRQLAVPLTWAVSDTVIALPADFHHPEKVNEVDACLPPSEYWGQNLVLHRPAESAGSVTLLYWGEYPQITSEADSLLPQLGDDGCLSYALYRFFKRLASSRSDYRRYATISNSNGVDISELDSLSEKHLADFNDARELLQEHRLNVATFWD